MSIDGKGTRAEAESNYKAPAVILARDDGKTVVILRSLESVRNYV